MATEISIEALLRWAFVFELVKVDRFDDEPLLSSSSAWAIVERIGELGTMVDTFGGGSPERDDEPHPDALVVAEAVADLDDMVVSEGDAHDLMAGWPDFGAAGDAAIARAWDLTTLVDGAGRRRLRSPLSALVRRAAVLNLWPDWRGEVPTLTPTIAPSGRLLWFRRVRIAVEWTLDGAPLRYADVEVDGYDRVRQRPYPGAYRKNTLSPDPSPILAKRIEYGLTHAATRLLASRLDGLGGRRILPTAEAPVPWGGSEVVAIAK